MDFPSRFEVIVIGGDQANGITVRGIAFDTMLESYVLNSTATRRSFLGKEANYWSQCLRLFKFRRGRE